MKRYLEPAAEAEVRGTARVFAEGFAGAVEPESGGDYCAAYAAALAIAQALRRCVPPELVPELDAIAEDLARERLAQAGLSLDGPT